MGRSYVYAPQQAEDSFFAVLFYKAARTGKPGKNGAGLLFFRDRKVPLALSHW